ncbi:hypothetical protein K504DRAFT_497597 [Pleomassaria siparia CBS 279.74]|uniref:Uncharacterized protein n=1 Tax=Pleomassaria siparia CBS 279.74 TaxID=1314801 RepID=A0A6G1KT60_9PLEO|nr:hypothetical protein K504DRAFT_497597 [Pleomassaria siparia CBS 279.74]
MDISRLQLTSAIYRDIKAAIDQCDTVLYSIHTTQKSAGLRVRTFVHSGPNLKQNIPEVSKDAGVFNYQQSPSVPGALAHASQPNERLALVTFSDTQYLFAYTCKERAQGFRECGINTNQLRELIDKFFVGMETGKSIGHATQAVRLLWAFAGRDLAQYPSKL